MTATRNENQKPTRAVILLSGGLDSAVTLGLAKREGYACFALTVDYGQRHRTELGRAAQVAKAFGAEAHKTIQTDMRAIGGSALTADIPVPPARENPGAEGDNPATYVPARNTILLSLGLAWAEVLQAEAIFIGVNAVDYSGYPDCRPEYLEAFQRLANLATQAGTRLGWQLKIQAPLLRKTKAEIVHLGQDLGLDFSLTSSCYNPDTHGRPCGQCEACQLRQKGFAEAGVKDPTRL